MVQTFDIRPQESWHPHSVWKAHGLSTTEEKVASVGSVPKADKVEHAGRNDTYASLVTKGPASGKICRQTAES